MSASFTNGLDAGEVLSDPISWKQPVGNKKAPVSPNAVVNTRDVGADRVQHECKGEAREELTLSLQCTPAVWTAQEPRLGPALRVSSGNF